MGFSALFPIRTSKSLFSFYPMTDTVTHKKPTVVFCTSVKHAQEVASLFRAHGVDAHSVSGSTKAADRKKILEQYEHGTIPVLCACDLLNEGWDSPHTQVLFMARPTMSKTIYMQQLGRGMRKSPGKKFLISRDDSVSVISPKAITSSQFSCTNTFMASCIFLSDWLLKRFPQVTRDEL